MTPIDKILKNFEEYWGTPDFEALGAMNSWYVQTGKEIVNKFRHSLTQMREETRRETLEEIENKYKDIFDWLLGQNGDFPNLAEKPHYSFRTELRERLSRLTRLKEKEI